MKLVLPVALSISLLACGGSAPPPAIPGNTAPPPAGTGAPLVIERWDQETFGPLALGVTEDKVIAALGEPDSRPAFEEMAATGESVAAWAWAAKGISLEMRETGGGQPAVVNALTMTAPATFRSGHGRIAIGSTFDEVKAAYADVPVGPDDDPRDAPSRDHLTIGSVYGGLMFTFEDDRLVTVFMGAGAE